MNTRGVLSLILALAVLAWPIFLSPANASIYPLLDHTIKLLNQAQDAKDEAVQSNLLNSALQVLQEAHVPPDKKTPALALVQSAISDLATNDSDMVSEDITQAIAAITEIITPTGPVPSQEVAVTLTPPSPPTPLIHGAKVFGVHPGSPFLFTVAATGDRPMTFSADDLPDGLVLDSTTGQITGTAPQAGDYRVVLHAKNKLGNTQRMLLIKAGPTLALTPPMGWNSWNCFARSVSDAKIRATADAMVQSGLINHGWTFVNIDNYWEVNNQYPDPTLHGKERDANGTILPNSRFPDMKALTQYIHDRGLKAGIYSSPGRYNCSGCTGSYRHETQDAMQYAAWGFDYLKYDWCSYSSIYKWSEGVEGMKKPYQIMAAALNSTNRDIVFSFCQYGMGQVWHWGAEVGGNSWRTTGDIRDNWDSIRRNASRQNGIEAFAGPGHWNDPDMLVVGQVGWGTELHPSHLTPDEQYTHISLWCLQAAPLLIGCDLTQLDPFTLGLLTNDEVLDIDQDPLGQAAHLVKPKNATRIPFQIWARKLEDGSVAVGIFNMGPVPASGLLNWSDLQLTGAQIVRDLWRQKDLGTFDQQFRSQSIPPHGVLLVRLRKAEGSPELTDADADAVIYPDQPRQLITDWGYDIKENGKAELLTPEMAHNLFVEDKMTCLRIPIYGDGEHPAHPANGQVIERYYTGILQAMTNARNANSQVVYFASKKSLNGKTFPGWVRDADGVIPEAYAGLLADYLGFMQAHGFIIDILGIDNEMEFNKGEITPQKYQEIIDSLRSLSKLRGFTMPRRLIGPDTFNPNPKWVNELDNMGWGNRLDIVSTHYYPNRPLPKLLNLVQASGDKSKWHTELHWEDHPKGDIFNESERALAAFFDCTDNGFSGFVWWDYERSNATIRGDLEEALTQSTIKSRPIDVEKSNGSGSQIVLGKLIVRAFRNDTSIVVWAINNNPTGAYEDYKFRLENGSVPNKVSYKQWTNGGQTSGMAALINQNTFTLNLPPKTITLVTIPE